MGEEEEERVGGFIRVGDRRIWRGDDATTRGFAIEAHPKTCPSCVGDETGVRRPRRSRALVV
jgi:hypothetical protein